MSNWSVYVRNGIYFSHKEVFSRISRYLKEMPEFKKICTMDVPQGRFWPEKSINMISLQTLFNPKDRMAKLMRIDMGIDETFERINNAAAERRKERSQIYRKYKFKVTGEHFVDVVAKPYASCAICNRIIPFIDSRWNRITINGKPYVECGCCNVTYVRSAFHNDNEKWHFMNNPKLEVPNG